MMPSQVVAVAIVLGPAGIGKTALLETIFTWSSKHA
jgi:ABC-type branched-subunit amino acid transport system ATPase component